MKCPFDLAQRPCFAAEPHHTTRRHFLEVVSAGGVAIFAGGCMSSSSGGDPAGFGDVSAGLVSNLPVGTMRLVAGAPVLIARDDQGVYAMTNTCTHQGTALAAPLASVSFLVCPSHGSRFDRNGAVLSGPAALPLVHFAVEIDAAAGSITVHGGTQVGAAVRIPV
jgi:Rieske Fe-S protein